MDQSKYSVSTQFSLAPNHLESLILLYQPVFAHPALSLYMTLYEIGKVEKEVAIQRLSHTLDVKRDDLSRYRIELERFGLLRTYQSDHLTIEVLAPLEPADFILHPTYARLFTIVMGHDLFIDYAHRFRKNNHFEGEDITHSFDLSRLAIWDEGLEKNFMREETYAKEVSSQYNVEAFFANLPLRQFPAELRTEATKKVVGSLGSLYNLSFSELRAALYAATNFQTLTFNERKFRFIIEEKHGDLSIEQVQDAYELDPISFLKHIQKHDYVVQADRNLIQSLTHNFKFNDEVINVLLEYVLKVNHNQLNRAYVEKIASVWKRDQVTTKEEAQAQISGQDEKVASKKRQAQVKRHVPIPEYSKDETIDEDVDALKAELYEMLGKGEQS